MKAAVTVWNERISPVFDVSREAVILTIENGAIVARCTERIEAPTDAVKIDRLKELGVETLICGAISEPLFRDLTARGVRVLGFVAGDLNEVVQAFLANTLPSPALSMPGYCCKQRRFRGGDKPQSRGRGWRSKGR
jgi:predicted Fe-Mo cluster-binding NifX family protein